MVRLKPINNVKDIVLLFKSKRVYMLIISIYFSVVEMRKSLSKTTIENNLFLNYKY